MRKIALIILVIVLLFSCVACGAKSDESLPNPQPSMMPKTSPESSKGQTDFSVDYVVSSESSGRMIVYTYKIYLEVQSVKEAYTEIKSSIPSGGWVESEDFSGDYATITLRVPSNISPTYVDGLSTLGEVETKRVYSEDFTDAYSNIESTIEVLELEKERLIELYEGATIQDSIDINTRLAQIESSLKNLYQESSSIKSLNEFSTVIINLNKKFVEEKDVLFGELGSTLVGGLTFFLEAIEGLVTAILFMLPFIIIIGIVLIILKKCGKLNFKRKPKQQKEAPKNEKSFLDK